VSEPPWLTPEQQAAWRAFLTAKQLLERALGRQLLRDSGMPHAYYEVLVRLSERPDRCLRMSDLAATMDYSQSRLSHAVARLEVAGWVRRESCPADRRGTFAVLTDAGFAVLAAAAPGHVRAVRELMFDQLTDQQVQQLREICEAMTRAITDDLARA